VQRNLLVLPRRRSAGFPKGVHQGDNGLRARPRFLVIRHAAQRAITQRVLEMTCRCPTPRSEQGSALLWE
jgi:hypothetical protein